MFEIGWLELLVIAVVLIVVVGPKDLPGMLRTFGRTTSQLRRMAGDFRKQFDDALREAELDDVRKAAGDLQKLNPSADIKRALNPMKSVGDEIRSSLKAAAKAPEPAVAAADAPAQPMQPPVAAAPEPSPAAIAAAEPSSATMAAAEPASPEPAAHVGAVAAGHEMQPAAEVRKAGDAA